MRTVCKKYANRSNHFTAKIAFFSTETITVLIAFRLFVIAQLSPIVKKSEIYLIKWDGSLDVHL